MALTKITTSLVAVNTLTAANIADNTIDATKIAQNQILARHIASGALSDQIAGISSSADATAITITSGEDVGIGTSPNFSSGSGLEIERSGTATLRLQDSGNKSAEIRMGSDLEFVSINSGSNIVLDATGDIVLDADGQDVLFKDGGTQFGSIRKNGNNIQLMASIEDGDITFHGDDSGTAITALKLDMSAGGKATFRGGAVFNEDSLNSDFRIESDGNANMFVVDASADKIGIGTASPAHELDVAGSVALSGHLELSSGQSIDWANGDARIKEGVTNNYDLQFQTYDGSNCSTKLTIQGGGNIGIGTTSPSGKLDIHTVDTSAYSNSGEPVETAVIHNESGADGTGVNYYSSLGMTVGAGATSQGFINYVRTADNQGRFAFSQRTGSSTYAETFTILNDGKVGIGTTSPVNNLHIDGVSNYNGVEVKGSGASRPMIQWSNVNQGDLGAIYGTESNALVICSGSSNTAAITIDSSQRVNMPAQPAFRAYLGSSFAVSAGTHTFAGSDKLSQEFDIGGNYNPSTGKFTTPVAGIYHFSATITMSANTSSITYLSAEIIATPSGENAKRYVVGGWNSKTGTTNAYSSSAGSVTLQLAANTEVTLGYETSGAINIEGGYSHTSFSGHLVA